MQTFESFIRKHPRFKIKSHLSRRGIKTIDQAVKHFQAMNVQIEQQLLESALGITAKDKAEPKAEQADYQQDAVLTEQSDQQDVVPKTRSVRRKKTVENDR